MKLLDDFVVLELNKWGVLVTVSVIFSEDGKSFLSSIVGDEPPGRLGKEQNHDHNNRGEPGLDDSGDAPCPRSRDISDNCQDLFLGVMVSAYLFVPYVVHPAKIFPSHQKLLYLICQRQPLNKIERFIHSGHSSSVCGVGHLNCVRGASSGCKSCTKSKNKSSPNELSSFMCRSLDCSSNQDNQTSDEDTHSSSISICEKSAEWECRNLTHIIDDEDDSGTGSGAA